MTLLEADIESWVSEQAWTRFGVPSIKLNVKGETGWPDRVFLLQEGRSLWIEFKRPGGTLSAKQKLKIEILEYRGHNVQVHEDRYTALVAIKAALDAA
jgi:VRR-NUC domain